MQTRLSAATLALVLTSATAFAQGPPSAPTDAEMERFLRKARIVSTKRIGIGVTESVRAVLSDGAVTHDAHIQVVDNYRSEVRSAKGIERHFRDSWRYNIAAYRLDRMLDLRLVPVSVERYWKGRAAAFTWWVDDVMMDERKRQEKALVAPDHECFTQQSQALRMFDQLIENTDRNLGNTLYSSDWRIWAIDHTRAFRRSSHPETVAEITSIDGRVLDRLAALDFKTLKQAIGRYVDTPAIRKLLSRRDVLVAHYGSLSDGAVAARRGPPAGCITRRANAGPSFR